MKRDGKSSAHGSKHNDDTSDTNDDEKSHKI